MLRFILNAAASADPAVGAAKWAALGVIVAAFFTFLTGIIQKFTKELRPNSGSSMNDKITRLVADLSEMKNDLKTGFKDVHKEISEVKKDVNHELGVIQEKVGMVEGRLDQQDRQSKVSESAQSVYRAEMRDNFTQREQDEAQ